MASQIDGISEAIGALRASVEGLKESVASESVRSSDSRNRVLIKLQDLEEHVQRVDATVSELKTVHRKVQDLERKVEDLTTLRAKGVGVLLTIALLAGASGNAFTAFVRKVFGG